MRIRILCLKEGRVSMGHKISGGQNFFRVKTKIDGQWCVRVVQGNFNEVGTNILLLLSPKKRRDINAVSAVPATPLLYGLVYDVSERTFRIPDFRLSRTIIVCGIILGIEIVAYFVILIIKLIIGVYGARLTFYPIRDDDKRDI